MDRNEFWKIIDDVNAKTVPDDQEAVLGQTEAALLALPSREIAEWGKYFGAYHELAYRQGLWMACKASRSHCTGDGFIDFRNWLISRGREVYTAALKEPDSLAALDIPEGTADFELYGYAACYAYPKRVLLEQGGPGALREDFAAWKQENAGYIESFYSQSQDMEPRQKAQRIARRYLSALCGKFDLYELIWVKDPLDRAELQALQDEMQLAPDPPGDWDTAQMQKTVPRLYAKYGWPELSEGMPPPVP